MKRGTHNHPKVWITCKILGIRRPALLGHLELLWDFTTQYAPQGDIGRYPDDRIEAAMDWSGRRGKLLDGLVQGGWVERHPTYRLVIHDWHDHCNESVRKSLVRRKEPFLTISTSCAENVSTLAGHRQTSPFSVAENGSLPLPLPLPLPKAIAIPPAAPDDFDFPAWFEALYALGPKKGMKHQARSAMATDARITDPIFRRQVESNWKLWAEYMSVEFHPKRMLLEWWNDEGWADTIPKAQSKLDYQLDHMEE
jgi:hypothetical protein